MREYLAERHRLTKFGAPALGGNNNNNNNNNNNLIYIAPACQMTSETLETKPK